MTIKAIQTRYKGYHFRSRLEARWAVFFDSIGLRWEYEQEGFEVDSGGGSTWRYLPDFKLLDLGCWVEVKGSLDDVSDDYLYMIACAVDWGGCLPGIADSLWSSRGLLWLGPIPQESAGVPAHKIIQHHEGGWMVDCIFTDNGIETVDHGEYFDSSWGPQSSNDIRGSLTKAYQNLIFPSLYYPKAYSAYADARSARFEFGMSGAT